MENSVQILIELADALSGPVNLFFATLSDGGNLPAIGVIVLAAVSAITYSDIPAELLAAARRWHGSIDEQFSNIDNLVVTIQAHATTWDPPELLFTQITTSRDQLAVLIPKCRSAHGAPVDRALRNTQLKTTVGQCVTQMKAWAYTQYYANVLTIDDVHTLGFILPGEAGGRHFRAEATDAVAEVKVTIVSADIIRVVIDQAAVDNAALVVHGWPPGVRMALIVITAADGVTEVLRLHTTHLYNDIRMPDGSHGKQFIIKGSFLRHVDDEPRFGPQPTFSMPLTTEDLAAAIDRQHHEEYEAHLREIERHRRELEQLPPTPPNVQSGGTDTNH